MLGAFLNNHHTGSDFGLGWLGMSISEAEVKTHYIEIEGRDGPLDATEALSGRPVYKQRTLTLSFDARGSWEEYMTRCTEIDSLTNGRYVEIFLDIDPEYFWVGRGKWKHTKSADGDESHTFIATVEPYKYQKYKTELSVIVDGTQKVILQNLQAPAYPLLYTEDQDMRVQSGSVQYSIPIGAKVPFYDITLLEGCNEVVFSGNGRVRIEYQEGIL